MTSIFSNNIRNKCEDDLPFKLRLVSLKAIGNIGYTSYTDSLEKCASNKNNSIEMRVNAIQAFRKFSCEQMEDLNVIYEILQDLDEEVEVRISSFMSIMRCSDKSENFKMFAKDELTNFLLKENNKQVILNY